MQLTIRGKNVDVTEALRDYAAKKIGRTTKYFTREPEVVVTLAVERGRHIVEVTFNVSGMIIRAEGVSDDMYASIDSVVDKIERQIRKFKTRINRRARRLGAGKPLVQIADDADEEPVDEPRIVKTKRFPVKPMDTEEAILQMNLLGHDFFVFRNAESNEVNILYRRRDGNYGLIEPSS